MYHPHMLGNAVTIDPVHINVSLPPVHESDDGLIAALAGRLHPLHRLQCLLVHLLVIFHQRRISIAKKPFLLSYTETDTLSIAAGIDPVKGESSRGCSYSIVVGCFYQSLVVKTWLAGTVRWVAGDEGTFLWCKLLPVLECFATSYPVEGNHSVLPMQRWR